MSSFWQILKTTKKPIMALAPLDGVTDFVFRQLIAETAKPDVLYTEFTNVDGLASKGYEHTIKRLKFSDSQHFIVAQIWGTKVENFYTAAKMIQEMGFDGIDLNMGCPVQDVMKTGCGSALIKNPELAKDFLQATREGAPKLPISVKTRIGINSIQTTEWIGFLLKQSLAELTIHGRTAKELSKVPAHWDEIQKAVGLRDQLSPNTIILGNGDVTSYEMALEYSDTYNVDGIMIGRGIFTNPWFFDPSGKEHTQSEHLELLLKHTKMFCNEYPDPRAFNVMKKFFKVYVRGFPNANELKVQLMETETYSEVEKLILPLIRE